MTEPGRHDEQLNPFRPGAGHPPPFLAGREVEQQEFAHLLKQRPVLANLVLTGLRGVGKTVLLETLKPIARNAGWLWTGTDLSESASVSEEKMAVRILADLAPLASNIVVDVEELRSIGFGAQAKSKPVHLDFELLRAFYEATPGLASDKLRATLELVWRNLAHRRCKGIVLAYDEAQNLADQAARNEYPLSLLLDVFQSIQKKEIPILLVLTGLPTLFPKLVEARTFAERMFHVRTLGRLNEAQSRDAILKPIHDKKSPVKFSDVAVREITKHSGGYPYFIQFLCREMYDAYLHRKALGEVRPAVTVEQTVRKLDSDFFAGRWNRVTDRQRDLLAIVAELPNCEEEFTVQEVVAKSKELSKRPFGSSQVSQMFAALSDSGLVYKNRHGRYSFAVPLLGGFIRRLRTTFDRP